MGKKYFADTPPYKWDGLFIVGSLESSAREGEGGALQKSYGVSYLVLPEKALRWGSSFFRILLNSDIIPSLVFWILLGVISVRYFLKCPA